jgi:glycosyl transferase family 25
MKVYVISLARAKDRRQSITKQLNRLHCDYTIIDAVDGYALSQEELFTLADPEAIARAPRYLNPGQIGCSQSHLNCYKSISTDNLRHALILEDDMVLRSFSLEKLKLLAEKYATEKSVILLYYRSPPSGRTCHFQFIENHTSSFTASRIAYPLTTEDIPLCTGAYIITRAACQSLASNLAPIAHGADQWDVFLSNGWIDHLFVVHPRLAKGASFDSEIKYSESYDVAWTVKLTSFLTSFFLFRLLKRLRRLILEKKMSKFVFH